MVRARTHASTWSLSVITGFQKGPMSHLVEKPKTGGVRRGNPKVSFVCSGSKDM
jgi:hypothetical protein